MIVPQRPTARPTSRTENSAMTSHRARRSATGVLLPVERLRTHLAGPEIAARQHPLAAASLAREPGCRLVGRTEGDGHDSDADRDPGRAEYDLARNVEEIRRHGAGVIGGGVRIDGTGVARAGFRRFLEEAERLLLSASHRSERSGHEDGDDQRQCDRSKGPGHVDLLRAGRTGGSVSHDYYPPR